MIDPKSALSSPLEYLRASVLAKAFLIGALVLVLQIPILLIWQLVSERDRTRLSAQAEVTEKWGQAQRIHGPFLVVPYTYLKKTINNEGKSVAREHQARATFLPSGTKRQWKPRCRSPSAGNLRDVGLSLPNRDRGTI